MRVHGPESRVQVLESRVRGVGRNVLEADNVETVKMEVAWCRVLGEVYRV